jgi:hypothetical protein
MSRALVFGLAAWLLLSGCELVADFDRSKIVTDAGQQPEPDASGSDDDASIIFPDGAIDDAAIDGAAIDGAAGDEDAGF